MFSGWKKKHCYTAAGLITVSVGYICLLVLRTEVQNRREKEKRSQKDI